MDFEERIVLQPPLTDQIRAYVKALDNLSEQQEALAKKKSDMYAEARACGIDTRTLRKAVKRRRLTPAQRKAQDEKKPPYDLLVAYEGIVGDD